jgi:hypothetical protein
VSKAREAGRPEGSRGAGRKGSLGLPCPRPGEVHARRRESAVELTVHPECLPQRWGFFDYVREGADRVHELGKCPPNLLSRWRRRFLLIEVITLNELSELEFIGDDGALRMVVRP